MDLHGEIMNIRCLPACIDMSNPDAVMAYKLGHRDARHAAAELVTTAAALSQPAAQGDSRADMAKELANMHHDLLVVMQAAWIEWQRGAGANSAMQWIHNTLMGPGLIPDDDEPYASEPQAYFDKNKAEPFPECFCGRPSNQLWMGNGFCSNAHYNQHRASSKGGAA